MLFPAKTLKKIALLPQPWNKMKNHQLWREDDEPAGSVYPTRNSFDKGMTNRGPFTKKHIFV